MKIKTFKCSNCKNIYQIFKKMLTSEKLFDQRKYWRGKLLCGKCYNREFQNRRLTIHKINHKKGEVLVLGLKIPFTSK